MFELSIENKNKQVLNLTQNESNYQVINVSGLNPPKANVYTSKIAGLDGEKFKSSNLDMRNIVIQVKVNGNAEENRINLYNYFATGQWCKIYYSNGSRNVFIEGYCETLEAPLFDLSQVAQISIVCPEPYFKSLRAIYADISKLFSNFEFPFDIQAEGVEFSALDLYREVTIMNNGESETGIKIIMTAKGTVTDPVIYDVKTNEHFKLNITLNEGDVVKIDTTKGNKKVTKISNTIETNIINLVDYGSTWLQLKIGANVFSYSATNAEDLKIEFESNLLYEGV